MAENAAYNLTTETIPDKAEKFLGSELERRHFFLKVAQLVLSLVAFICEEVIEQCESCTGLYIFEFVSCSAFLLALLMLIVYWTPLRRKIIIASFKKIDFYVTAIVGICFIIASIVFAATMDQDSRAKVSVAFGFFASIAFLAELFFMYKSGYIAQSKETTAAGANGTVENQPLNVPVQASA
ncbi:CKLF-like MARVEL transmembrane domain-containing protein 6 isoform X1 [Hyla sarda]|uniref:CKLF-like MARVEL transmembrane domain-containing protein 6 isoform X1 n=1 Tax=Hyla sarda TaxID=327740 RepID=UPI0024C45722|nr:CKLF-like MARVEL transmembrane domain-containing protein 6 isoform X1 [Hyla sarda]